MLISTATVTGSAHIRPGQPGKVNNQDAIAVRSNGDTQVIVLADGCGSQPHSEIGADIGANLAANLIIKQLQKRKSVKWEQLTDDLTAGLLPFITMYANASSFEDALIKRFMFTLMVVVIHEGKVTIASFGDGMVILDDDIINIDLPIENTPPYLGYLFLKDSPYHKEFSEYLQFYIVHEMPLSDITKSLAVATDGLAAVPIEEIHHPGLLAKPNALQFWLNTHAIERVEDNTIVPGICSDDVTMVLIRNKEAQERLTNGRSNIVKLKNNIKDLLGDLSDSINNKSMPKKQALDELGCFKERMEEFTEIAEKLNASLDCRELLRRVDERFLEFKEIAERPEIIIAAERFSIPSFSFISKSTWLSRNNRHKRAFRR